MIAFYDTSSLLLAQDKAFVEHFIISSVTLSELEHIKTSDNRSPDIKYKARKLVHLLDEHRDAYTVVHENTAVHDAVDKHFVPLTNDNIIMASASMTTHDVFYSEDLCMRIIGKDVFELETRAYDADEDEEPYTGYKQVQMTESEYAMFLNELFDNKFECLVNEYVIVYDNEFDLRDCWRWTGERFVPVFNKQLKSLTMGDKIKSKDEFQRCTIDSIMNLQITAMTGRAGSGKSLMALYTAMHLIDTHKYETLVILFNPTSTRGAAKMGYYSGNSIEKAKQTSIGHILNSKFGDPFIVDNLIATNRLKLISMADARGCEVDDKSILYITEAQNTSADLLKLCLQRAANGCKVIIEGDPSTQVDDSTFLGDSNGLRKAIKMFKGDELFGYIDLPNIWRSKVAELAEKL